MSQANNQRQFVRMPLENLEANINREDGSTLNGTCVNLSGMGMLINVSESLNIEEKLNVSIKTAKNELEVVAVVMREEQGSDKPGFSYGLKIESIS